MQHFRRCLSAAFCAVEVSVEADDGESVLLRGGILVGVVEVEIEPLYCVDKALRISRVKMYQTNCSVCKGILDETQQHIRMVQPAQHHPDRVKGEIGDKEMLLRQVIEKKASFFRPYLI